MVRRESWSITVDQWRGSEQMVLESIALARNLTYRAQLDVLHNSHQCHTLFTPIGVNPTDRIVHQARIEGFELCLNYLESMAKPLKKHAPLEATFADPDQKPTTTKRR